MFRRLVLALTFGAALVGAGVAAGGSGATSSTVVAYPSAQSISPTGKLPSGGGKSITLNEPIGGDDAALVVVSNAKAVGLTVDTKSLGGIGVGVRFRHFVRFGSALVPDALLPWDGSVRPVEEPNQPLSIEVSVPYGTAPGAYKGSVTATVDTKATVLPLTINVYNVQLPKPGDVKGSLLTVFGIGPQAYVNRAIQLFGYKTDAQIRAVDASLFAFLSAYRIAPDSWGYGIPSNPSGYTASTSWWKDNSGQMISQLQAGQFPDLWIPISNNRASSSSYIAGLSPSNPESWCSYLGAVNQFWTQHGFLQNGAIPYIYPYDEPGDTHTSLLSRQAMALHKCFPGGKMLVTATPDTNMSRLYDGKGTDDVDIWAAVDWRYYGVFTVPAKQKSGLREHQDVDQLNKARSHGAKVFAYTYYGVPGFPSFSATEPLSNPRMFVLWTALEGIDGILYAQGMTTYPSGNPLNANIGGRGESVLIYPGDGSPIASARLEEIRQGIEDWEIFNVVRQRFGAAKVRQILGAHGLFSATASKVQLACVVGCDLKSTTPQAWPRWSHDTSTAGRIEAARRDALKLAASR
ncbi:MAG TPA: glycoside hydrolase domain-containing protein [Gaiellaceae bacterium]|nr:glycoside hydrolase domain-containing protein [Gaiellaceae bacterium]